MPALALAVDELAAELGLTVEVERAKEPGRGKRGNSLEVWYVSRRGRCLGSFVPATKSIWRAGIGCERCGDAATALRLFAEVKR